MASKMTCPECSGKKLGRGFAHKAGCSLARPAGGIRKGNRRRRGGRSMAAARVQHGGAGVSIGLDLRILKGMDIEALAKLRESVNRMIKTKAPMLKNKIKSLQATLASIR